MVLAEYVREEVEENLIHRAATFPAKEAAQTLDDYTKLLKLARPEMVSLPSAARVAAARRLIAHAADVPVLLSAMEAKPDWLLTHNHKHFTPQVARRCSLRIASPAEFFALLSRELG